MRSALLALAAVACLVLSACGGSSGGADQPTTSAAPAAPAPATTDSTPASTPPATTSAQPTTTSVATPPVCRAGDLSAGFLGGQAATGHGLLGFALRNLTGHACATYGYPGILFLSRAGQPLPTLPTHTTQDFFGSLPKLSLTVAPRESVSFRLGVTHGAASTANCTTAWALQVIPPNDTSTLRISLPQGAYECQTATVSPMQQGTSAYP